MDSAPTLPIRPDAVLCGLAEQPDGLLRVVLDDLRAEAPDATRDHTFVAFKDQPADVRAALQALPDAALAQFGFRVLVRLMTLNGYLHDAEEGPDSDVLLTFQQRQNIAALTAEDIAGIDGQLLSHCDGQFRKIAFIVGSAMSLDPERRPGIVDFFYAARVRDLVARGVLEAQGDLSRMRYCEVRIPRQP